jgi:hypothetical protein
MLFPIESVKLKHGTSLSDETFILTSTCQENFQLGLSMSTGLNDAEQFFEMGESKNVTLSSITTIFS